MKMLTSLIIAVVVFLSGCSTLDKTLKRLESRAYDAAAESASQYCQRTENDLGRIERNQARREIRQRGHHGPNGPKRGNGLDGQTAYGRGPVVRVYCQGDTVPAEVFKDLERQ